MRGRPFHGDLRALPQVLPEKVERPEFEEPRVTPAPYTSTTTGSPSPAAPVDANSLSPSTPAPSPSSSFEGLDFATWGAGHPPDTNGDVGPTYYIQAINTSIGIFRKSDGVRVAAFTFNSFLHGHFGNLCDTNNFGDPVVVYDTFEDRWIITDFAFKLSGGNPAAPVFQCFAVSQSGDPVGGGWNFYSIRTAITAADAFDDYPKFGIWPDGLYMSANMFAITGGGFQNVRIWAFNKAQMYAGAPTIQILSFDGPTGEFTLLPSNARLQAGTPPSGTPNYFASVFNFTNAVSVYKFHADWNNTFDSTLSGPFIALSPASWANAPARVPSGNGGTNIDTLAPRLMVQNQYANIGGLESLWASHTVRGAAATNAAPRYYQVDVTGGTVGATTTQAATFNPDAGAVNRFMPSVAVDRAGDMALGYTASSSTLFPALRYAGRLAGDAANAITQTETSLIEGSGTQNSAAFTRWGDYSAMTLDPDGCTFWYTNMYYQVTGTAFNTRIGAFSFPSCTPVATGTVSGAVTASASGAPMQGVTVSLGSRTTTTALDGTYSFTGLPSGAYPSITASFSGFNSSTTFNVIVSDGATTAVNFALSAASANGCLTDTTQTDFQGGVPTNADLNGSPGDVILLNAPSINQQNPSLSGSSVGVDTTTWGGQTFTPSVTGQLTRADISLFCLGCTGSTPDLTLSIQATSGGLPAGPDLGSTTITGFNTAAARYHTATFSSPIALTAGTQYALVVRPVTNPSPGTYGLTRSATDVYAGGARVSGATSGTVWTSPLTGTATTDAGFKIFLQTGFTSSGTFVSSTKDSNPSGASTANWGSLSWTASTPANTSIQFQAAASNSSSGPFNFAGPDGTSATFFSNGGSLIQFNGFRYLKYQTLLGTTDNTATPTLNDVTLCFVDIVNTTLTVNPASGSFGGTADLSATLTAGATGISGKTLNFTLNGSSVGSGLTDGTGVATLSAVSLTGINAGSYPGAVAATFAGDAGFTASIGPAAALTIAMANQTITFGPLSDKALGDPDFSVTASASSGLAVSFAASGNCSVAGSTVHITGGGSCTVTASQAGSSNYNAAVDVSQSFTVAKGSQTITFGALSAKTFGDPDFSVTASASSGLAVGFAASGSCSVAGSTVHIIGAGSCTITASQAGDSNYNPAVDVPQSFTIAKGSQSITFGALSAKAFGDPDFAVSAIVSSNLTASFAASGNCGVVGSAIHITGAGSCIITASQAGDSNYNPASDVPQSFTIAKGSQTITLGLLSTKTFGDPDFAVSAIVSSNLTASFAASGNCSVVGSAIHVTGAGPCIITASQAGNGNFNPAVDVSQTLTINKAAPLMTVSCSPASFDSNPHTCTAAITGIGNVSVNGATAITYNGNPAPPTNAGTYSANGSFTSSDTNYVDATGSSSLIIARAIPTVTVTCPSGVIFDGNPHVCTAAATGVGNASVAGSSILTYNGGPVPSGGGTYAATASFTSADTNYVDASGSASLTIGKASQTISFGGLSARTLGDPDFVISATTSSSLPVSFATAGNCAVTGFTVHLIGAGSCTVTAGQAGNANYNAAASVPRSFVINAGDDFAIAPTAPSVTVLAGQFVIAHLMIIPSPSTLSALTFTCSGLPANSSCTFAPNPVPPGASPTDVVMTITTTGPTTAALEHARPLYAGWLGFTGMGLIGIIITEGGKKGRRKAGILGALSLMMMLMAMACGGGSMRTRSTVGGTPVGTSTVTVTGSTSTFSHSTTFTLTVN